MPPVANVPSRAGKATVPSFPPQMPLDSGRNPMLSRPPTIAPKRCGDDQAADEVEPGAAQDETDADPDQDQRPELPEPADLVGIESTPT